MKKLLKDSAVMSLSLFFAAAAFLVFYDTFFASRTLILLFRRFCAALQPVLIGCFIAYLLLPVVSGIDAGLRVSAKRYGLKIRSGIVVRAMSLLLTWLLVVAVCYVLISMILPQVVDSVVQLASNLENYYNKIYGWIVHLLENNPKLAATAEEYIQGYYTMFEGWVKETLLPGAQVLVAAAAGGVWTVASFAMDMVVGVIVSVYLLFSKESWAAGGRRALKAFFAEERETAILAAVRRADHIFSGFIRGKILDSGIIGVLCLGACLVLKMPYAPLVATIVGVTNVIPFFGPFLGAIPSAALILLVDPLKCVSFILMILVLQQFDGNILGPKILGDSTGLSSFWVIAAILVGGSFFGVAGMFFGVPVFACIYSLYSTLVKTSLEKKGLSTELEDYGTTLLSGEERPVEGDKE
ncbi:MAG: AI-2E family transporter [Oscillospiraceae bacterium]|nr:AI-2E family transporter [Oscillospiraceae bacterium]